MLSEHFTTAFVHIRRSPYQALAAILVMSLMFFSASIIAFLAYTAQITLHYLETRPQIIALIKNKATPEEISALQRKLNDNSKIVGVKFVSHEDAFKIFEGVVDNPLVTQLLPPDVFQASIEFSVTDLAFAQEIIDQLKSEQLVDQIEFTGSLGGEGSITSVINNLESITQYIRMGGAALLFYLVLTAVFILVIIIGMRTASRREEIEILKLIGATNNFIRMPFLLEALIYTIIGVLVGFTLSFLLLLYAVPVLSQYFGPIPVVPQSFGTGAMYFGILLGGEFFLAFFIGIIGSFIALARYLRL